MFPHNDIIINTGNVLNIIDINKKAVQNVTEELTECLQTTFDEWKKTSSDDKSSEKIVKVSRSNDDTLAKLAEEDRKNLKIGVKIFVQDHHAEILQQCLENVYSTLGIDLIENVILAYCPESDDGNLVNGKDSDNSNEVDSTKCDRILPGLLNLWKVLEKYVKEGRVLQVGVSDLEESCFKRLHAVSEIHPSIIQINLASCCVVPPGLQAFCKENDVQLLTHSDPQEIISKETLSGILSTEVKVLRWCLRYQVHIKCRGVLALKGFILSTSLK